MLARILPSVGIDDSVPPPLSVQQLVRGDVTFLFNHGDEPVLVPGVSGTRVDTGSVLVVADIEIAPRTTVLVTTTDSVDDTQD